MFGSNVDAEVHLSITGWFMLFRKKGNLRKIDKIVLY